MGAVDDLLKRIPDIYSPLREHIERYVRFGFRKEPSGAMCVGPNPKIAPDYFVFRLYPPSRPAWLAKRRSYDVPIDYLRFLAVTNGCFAYGISLYGFVPNMESEPGLLDRSSLQCHDLTTANEIWLGEYKAPKGSFVFGSRHYSYTENVGYFMQESGTVHCSLKSGREIARWTNFKDFLRAELAVAETYERQNNPGLYSAPEEAPPPML